jgi:hypothetical protein
MKTIKLITDTVFDEILKNDTFKSFAFLSQDSDDPTTAAYAQSYLNLVMRNKDNLETLSLLEKLIVQLRCKEFIDGNIKFSEVRGYIYARAPFYKNITKGNKDIRVVIGKVDEYPKPTKNLVHDPRASTEAKEKLLKMMDDEIIKSINEVELKLNKITEDEILSNKGNS